jgi:rhodanese-related sulfurtransferase
MLNKIGFYQFNNLVQNRIPFMFLNLGADLSNWYTSIYKIHVQTHQTLTTLDQAEAVLIERSIPKDFAILLVCQNGLQSAQFGQYLQKQHYTNVYVVDGGIQQMMTDRAQS